ncbi:MULTISPECIES: DUF885 domain-containing protein [Phenylobacterium]|uniref:Uncharacterized protein (DUF885 family) n=1 Tax=Phenylobacterium koreense TaxID=266125 RepID=A0ABV2EK07_9CAUL
MLNRRHLLAASAAAIGLGVNQQVAAQSPTAVQARLLYDQIFEGMLAADPLNASGLGLDTGRRAVLKTKVGDRSEAGRLGAFRPLIDARSQLKAINRQSLSGRDLTQYDTVVWFADHCAEAEKFPFVGVDSYDYPVPYVLTQLSGAYQEVPDALATKHGIETREDCEAYLARLNDFAKALGDEVARAKDNAARGVVPPDFIIDKAVAQLKALAAETGETSGLASSLGRRAQQKGLGSDWGAKAAAIVDGPVASGLAAQIALLTAQRRTAGHEASVTRGPIPAGFYEYALRFHTTTKLTPDEAHKIGLTQVADLTARLDPLLKAQGYTQGSVAQRLDAFAKDPAQLYPNTEAGRAELLAELNRQMAAVKAECPRVFNTIPRAGMEIRRVPPAIELGAPRGYAESGSLDGVRPGVFYINLRDTNDWAKWALPTLTYHEAVPGHLFQGALLLEAGDAPLLFKNLGFTAYGEGWGLYGEQLGDELGMYDAYPAGRIGWLQSFLYRAARIVLDTGIHSKGWSRERAIAYMSENVGLPQGAGENEIDRYVVWPGQACGYKIGHTEIDRLRTKAKQALGARFDIKGFHDAVLLGGSLPLDVLERVVDEWTVAQGRA